MLRPSKALRHLGDVGVLQEREGAAAADSVVLELVPKVVRSAVTQDVHEFVHEARLYVAARGACAR